MVVFELEDEATSSLQLGKPGRTSFSGVRRRTPGLLKPSRLPRGSKISARLLAARSRGFSVRAMRSSVILVPLIGIGCAADTGLLPFTPYDCGDAEDAQTAFELTELPARRDRIVCGNSTCTYVDVASSTGQLVTYDLFSAKLSVEYEARAGSKLELLDSRASSHVFSERMRDGRKELRWLSPSGTATVAFQGRLPRFAGTPHRELSLGGEVVWTNAEQEQVFRWNGLSIPEILFEAENINAPYISETGEIIWTVGGSDRSDVYIWRNEEAQLIDTAGRDFSPVIVGDLAAWRSSDGVTGFNLESGKTNTLETQLNCSTATFGNRLALLCTNVTAQRIRLIADDGTFSRLVSTKAAFAVTPTDEGIAWAEHSEDCNAGDPSGVVKYLHDKAEDPVVIGTHSAPCAPSDGDFRILSASKHVLWNYSDGAFNARHFAKTRVSDLCSPDTSSN